jgi:uncharacterized protein YeeX (DUF496 family)
MNSRGKPLTDFENFKANFSVLFDHDSKSKLDNEWLDIFWKFEKDNQTISLKEVDKKYLTFIENISLCFWSEHKDISKDEKDNFSIFKSYKNIYSSDSDYLNQITKIFDALITDEDAGKNYFENFLKLKSNPNTKRPTTDYDDLLLFYAVSQFFIYCGDVNDTNRETYNKWIRVCKNLINNSRIEDHELFYKALRSIKDLTTHIQDFYKYLSLPDTKIAFFQQDQCEEEKIKAKLIFEDKSNKWRKAIEKIEKHFYFKGQIGFILNFAKTENGYDIDEFLDYSEKLDKLFGLEFRDKDDCLFQRALLTFGDYLVPISGHYTFCKFENNLRAKMDNWRKVFNDNTRSGYLKQLLDSIRVNTIKDDLQKIVHNFQENNNDWKSLFIKNKEIIEYCFNYQINKWSNKIELARSPATAWRRCAELRSYAFYKTKLKDKKSNFHPFQNVWYYDSSDGSAPYAKIYDWDYQNEYSFALDISWSASKFSIIFYDRNWKILPDEIIDKLKQINFVEYQRNEITNEITSCKIAIDFDEIEQKIEELIEMIK